MLGGVDVLVDYEFLEFILFWVILRWDVKFLVKMFIWIFGLFGDVMSVEFVCFREIVGLGDSVIIELKVVEVVVLCLV